MASASRKIMARHPLQYLNSPSRGISALVHITGLANFSFTYWYLNAFPTRINESYGWHWQYLTIIGLALATATFVAGLLADITLSPTLFRVKNLLSICSAPLETTIAILYWGISAIDRTLVIPPGIEIDFLVDINFHAMPAILLITDLLFLSPPWTIQGFPLFGISGTIAFLYWGWIEWCFKYNGWYPYPIFQLLDTPQRVMLFTGAAFIMTGSAFFLKSLYGKFNGFPGSTMRSTPANIKGE